MAKVLPSIDATVRDFIGRQRIFFTASAAAGAHINLSPRGADAFAVLDDLTVCYLDLTGSGNETAAHMKADGRLTLHLLPGYAPELNPDELVWSHVKRTGVARTPLRKGEKLRDKIEAQLELDKLAGQPAQASEAVKYYSEALQRNPRDAVAHFQLGQAFDSLGQVADARTHYAAAVELQPDFAEAHCQLGIALGREDKTVEAAEQFAEAVRLKPDFTQAHVNHGVALAKQHRFEEAAREFEEALRLDPNDTLAQKSLAAARRSLR